MANVKAKKRVFNLIMVAAALVIVVVGIMAALNLKGGGAPAEPSVAETPQLVPCEKSGNANIVRSGLGYALDNDAVLQAGDQLETLSKSSIALKQDGLTGLRMGARTTVVLSQEEGVFGASLRGGSAVAWSKMPMDLFLCEDAVKVIPSEDSLVVLTQEENSATVAVLGGSASLTGVTAQAQQGNVITLLKTDGAWEATVGAFAASALSDESIAAVKTFISAGAQSVVSANDLIKISEEREAQRTEAQQQAVSSGYIAGDGTSGSAGSATSEGTEGGSKVTQPTCTIEIRCDTVLDNMSDLAEGKEGSVPANGTILATSKVAFNEGDTVFDVLLAACRAANIQLEYTFSGLYGANYIEGINNLYQFDCGEESGWLYKVNGWFPNYGCSKYELADGDVIVWCYSCKGLGADVGGAM